MDVTIDAILTLATDIFQAHMSTILLYNHEKQGLEVFVNKGIPEKSFRLLDQFQPYSFISF